MGSIPAWLEAGFYQQTWAGPILSEAERGREGTLRNLQEEQEEKTLAHSSAAQIPKKK